MTSTWTDVADGTVGQQFTADTFTDMADDLDFLRNPPESTYSPALGASTITTSSTTFVDLTSFSVTVTTQGRPIRIEFDARVDTANTRFDILIDGVSITGDGNGVGAAAGVSTFCAVSIRRRVPVSAAAHTVKIQWRVTTGTATLYPAGLAQLYAVED